MSEDGVREGRPISGDSSCLVSVHGRPGPAADAVRALRDLHAAVVELDPGEQDLVARVALRGCPFVVGIALDHQGEPVVFSVARDLRVEGLVPLDEITTDLARLRAYRSLPLELRVANAQALAAAYEHLERLRFVHGDLTGTQVLVRSRPRVPGATPDSFVDAAVVGFELGAVRAPRSGRHHERAQFAALVHRAVFGVAPSAHISVQAENRQLAEPLADTLRDGCVLTGRQWREMLAVAGAPPEFRELSVWPRGVVAGETVTVRWLTVPGRDVRVQGVRGVLPAQGEATVVVRRSGAIRLTASNAFGRTDISTGTVRVFTPPTIATVTVPRVPPIVVNAPLVHAPLPDLDVSAEALADAVTAAVRQRITVPRLRLAG